MFHQVKRQKTSEENGEVVYKCDKCPMIVKSAKFLANHKRSHTAMEMSEEVSTADIPLNMASTSSSNVPMVVIEDCVEGI